MTAVACKVMESLVKDAIITHMEKNKLIADQQHGFIAGRSCTTQLISTLEDWTKILDDGECVDAIYMDLKKAFDSVPHQRLLAKLKGYGIEGKLLKWIEIFLTFRKHCVLVNGAASSWTEVVSGVPQGSVLGPILFILYITDLTNVVICDMKIFADDTKIYHKTSTRQDCINLQKDIDRLQDWAEKWQLKFHPDKCKVLRIGHGHPEFTYTLTTETGENPLECSHVEKDLGILVDDQLKFTQQVQQAVSKTNRLLGVIRRTYQYLDRTTFLHLYKGLVRPTLEYGVVVWSPQYQHDIDALEAVQRRASRMVPVLRHLDYESRLKALNLPTLTYRRLRGDIIDVYKYLHGILTFSHDMFNKDLYEGTRGHSLKLFKDRSKRELRRHFFSQRVINIWNSLPDTVVTAPSVNTLKNRLDKHWRNQAVKYDYKATLRLTKSGA